MNHPALAVERLCVRFGGLTALEAVSFSVAAGEIYAVIGPNGAGKTSLFNAITGIHAAASGRVLIGGQPVLARFGWGTALAFAGVALASAAGAVLGINANELWEAAINRQLGARDFPWTVAWAEIGRGLAPSAWTVVPALCGALLGLLGAWSVWRTTRRTPELVARAGVGRTFQNIRLFRDMSVRDNILVGLDRRLASQLWEAAVRTPRMRREHAAALRTADEMLTLVGLAHCAEHSASSLPYGHQRRLEIARALASGPALLLLDEPAAGMNPSESQELMALIRTIRARGVTVLLIEHDMRVVMGISDRILVLHYGQRIAEGAPAEIRAHPEVIAAYLGKEEGA
jgi:ABC-type branched-subunit amino acid transport system ATPase component